MLVQNTGNRTLHLVVRAGAVELKPSQKVEMTEQEFKVLSREFTELKVVQTIIESDANKIEGKKDAKANGGKNKKQRK